MWLCNGVTERREKRTYAQEISGCFKALSKPSHLEVVTLALRLSLPHPKEQTYPFGVWFRCESLNNR